MTSMSDEVSMEEAPSPGAFLRARREQKKVSIEDVAGATKISLPILRAIEDDNFDRMPAEAFCRGFYSIYANYLGLDQEEVLSKYRQTRGVAAIPSTEQAQSPVSKSQHFSNYATPSSISPAANIAALALVFLIVFTGTCWYLNWNPINYISSIIMPQETAVMPAPTDGNSEQVAEETASRDVFLDK